MFCYTNAEPVSTLKTSVSFQRTQSSLYHICSISVHRESVQLSTEYFDSLDTIYTCICMPFFQNITRLCLASAFEIESYLSKGNDLFSRLLFWHHGHYRRENDNQKSIIPNQNKNLISFLKSGQFVERVNLPPVCLFNWWSNRLKISVMHDEWSFWGCALLEFPYSEWHSFTTTHNSRTNAWNILRNCWVTRLASPHYQNNHLRAWFFYPKRDKQAVLPDFDFLMWFLPNDLRRSWWCGNLIS